MATGKKSVLLYCDLIHTIEKMDDKTAGEFFKHYLRYINDQEPKTDNMVVELTFESVKQNLKRDLLKWENIKGKRSEAGKKSAESRALKRKQQNSTNPTSVKSVQQNSTNPTVTVNDTVTDINNNNNIPSVKKPKASIDFIKLLDFINTSQKREGKKMFTVFSQENKNKYKARLKDGYTSTTIANSIKNAALDPYHKENNYKYLTVEYLSRANTIDKYGYKTNASQSTIGKDDFISNPYNQV